MARRRRPKQPKDGDVFIDINGNPEVFDSTSNTWQAVNAGNPIPSVVQHMGGNPRIQSQTLRGGEVIVAHVDWDCHSYWCPIHMPSPHHMREWPQHWNQITQTIMRVCEHGEQHYDPDSNVPINLIAEHQMQCDGCCSRSGHVTRLGDFDKG